MKSLFYLLLLANLTFFLWEQFVRLEPPGTESAGRTERQLDSIVLLKELPAPPVIVSQETAKAEEAAPEAVETPPVQPETPTAAAQPVPVETPAAPPVPPAAPEPPPAQAEPPAPSAAKPVQTREFCARLGPYGAEMEAKSAGRGISGVREARVETRVTPTEDGYWVLRPPSASLEEAKTVKRKLMEQGAKDALILREGANANAVSLGYFRRKEGAETLLREYRAKGLEGLEIRARQGGKTEYWLHVRAKAEPAAWKATLERAEAQRPGLSVEEKARCGGAGAGRN